MEEAFKIKLDEDRSSVNLNSVCFSKQKYNEIIKKVIEAKCKTNYVKQPGDYRLLKKFTVLETGKIKRLVVPQKDPQSNALQYVHDDELFTILMETHLSLDHGGRDKMMKELRKHYKNITYKDIMMFLSVCEDCLKKHKKETKNSTNGLNSKCQINVIDYQKYPNGNFKFVLIYLELATKFCILKPLTSKKPEEAADKLIDIFTTLGTPSALQSDQESHFVKSLIDTLKTRWVKLQITFLKSEEPLERIDQEIEHMISTWMRDNTTSSWSEGLRFVQLEKNTTFHPAVNKSPYEALFKRPLNFALSSKKIKVEEIEKNSSGVKTESLEEECENEYDGQEDEMVTICKSEPGDWLGRHFCQMCGDEVQESRSLCDRCEEYNLEGQCDE